MNAYICHNIISNHMHMHNMHMHMCDIFGVCVPTSIYFKDKKDAGYVQEKNPGYSILD